MKMKMNSVVKLCTLTAGICPANASYAAGAQTATVTIHATVAPTCSISATSLEFNNYDPTSTTDKTGTGTVTLTCVKGSQPTISLTAGLNPNGAQRRMINAVTSDFLNYDLFKPTAANPAIDLPNTACVGTENQPWGLDVPSRLHPPIAPTADPLTYNICGVIPKGQSTVGTGDYNDTVTAEINF
jgi:spore coat protein U-like protein